MNFFSQFSWWYCCCCGNLDDDGFSFFLSFYNKLPASDFTGQGKMCVVAGSQLIAMVLYFRFYYYFSNICDFFYLSILKKSTLTFNCVGICTSFLLLLLFLLMSFKCFGTYVHWKIMINKINLFTKLPN